MPPSSILCTIWTVPPVTTDFNISNTQTKTKTPTQCSVIDKQTHFFKHAIDGHKTP